MAVEIPDPRLSPDAHPGSHHNRNCYTICLHIPARPGALAFVNVHRNRSRPHRIRTRTQRSLPRTRKGLFFEYEDKSAYEYGPFKSYIAARKPFKGPPNTPTAFSESMMNPIPVRPHWLEYNILIRLWRGIASIEVFFGDLCSNCGHRRAAAEPVAWDCVHPATIRD